MNITGDAPRHNHTEAFNLMTYVSDDGTEAETIWNSRDGVTPFVITLKSGKQATHSDWTSDVYAPNYRPTQGERIFVDMTPERALQAATANVQRWTQDGMAPDIADMYGTPEQAINALASQYMSRPGAPDLIEVKS